MDITSIVTLSILGVSGTAIYLAATSARRKETKQRVNDLKRLAEENGAVVTEYELCSNVTMGIDSAKQVLLFTKSEHQNNTRMAVALDQYQSCRLSVSKMVSEYKKEKVTLIDRIELILVPSGKVKAATTLEIYNSDHDNMTLSGELQFSEKWASKISEIIAVRRSGNRISAIASSRLEAKPLPVKEISRKNSNTKTRRRSALAQ